ncbi:MAG: lysophospholipid acyltransferase family protein [Calditrichota bacterium]
MPVLLLPNHSTWWDGFFAWHLNEVHFKRPFYLMMLQEQLLKYPFFRKLGVFGIDQGNAKGMLSSLNYAAKLLEQTPPPILTIFPQGELQRSLKRPLDYKKGIDWILKRYSGKVTILPLAMRCEFTDQQLPVTWFEFADGIEADSTNFPGINLLEKIETDLLESLESRILAGEVGMNILSGKTIMEQRA